MKKKEPRFPEGHDCDADGCAYDPPLGEVPPWIPLAPWEKAQFTVKDSGVRQAYDSGMQRDTQDGKPDYTLLPLEFLKRWAEHMTKGAIKYGKNNWRKANSGEELERFRASAMRHLMQWMAGEDEEDHASAVCFNIAAAEYVKGRVQ